MDLAQNKGKQLAIEVDGKKFARYAIKTRLITPEDKDISNIVAEYAKPHLQSGDIVFVSEKVVAVTQGRSYPLGQIKPSKLATWLSKYVTRTPIGIGLGSPQTMQLAIEEVGVPRIFLAAIIGALGKMIGIKGLFYIVAGNGARSIDGAVPYAIPPYNTYVSKGPSHARQVAIQISKKIGAPVVVVDANDFGINVLGASEGIDGRFIVRAIKDNPLGQTDEQTPIGIIREIVEPQPENPIRKATMADAKEITAIADLLRINIPYFIWADEGFIKRQINNGEYYVIEKDGAIVGMMSMRQRNHKMHIETLVVKNEFQSQGLGTLFLEFAKQYTKERGLASLHAYSFLDYNMSNFYIKRGFSELHFMGNYQGHKYHCFEMKIV